MKVRVVNCPGSGIEYKVIFEIKNKKDAEIFHDKVAIKIAESGEFISESYKRINRSGLAGKLFVFGEEDCEPIIYQTWRK